MTSRRNTTPGRDWRCVGLASVVQHVLVPRVFPLGCRMGPAIIFLCEGLRLENFLTLFEEFGILLKIVAEKTGNYRFRENGRIGL